MMVSYLNPTFEANAGWSVNPKEIKDGFTSFLPANSLFVVNTSVIDLLIMLDGSPIKTIYIKKNSTISITGESFNWVHIKSGETYTGNINKNKIIVTFQKISEGKNGTVTDNRNALEKVLYP